MKFVDPTGLSVWKKVPGVKNWWYRYDQSAGGKDPAHYHFGKGKDPKSSKFKQYNRRVYINKTDKETEIKQKKHGNKKGGKGCSSEGIDKDVPEDIIKATIEEENSNDSQTESQRVQIKDPIDPNEVKIPNTYFGLGKEEYFTEEGEVDYETAHYILGPKAPEILNGTYKLKVKKRIIRDIESGEEKIDILSYFDPKTGKEVPTTCPIPIVPLLPQGVVIPSFAPTSALIPSFFY